MTKAATVFPRTERPQYFAGQVLTAADLTAEQDLDIGLRRLHHRMLHGWGIASGLTVTGARGATVVAVGAGYALDAGGRELVLADPVHKPVPAVAGDSAGAPRTFCLVLRWRSDEDAVVLTRPGSCGSEGAVRRRDEPDLEWMDPAEVRVGLDLTLAQVQIQGCRLIADPDHGARRLLNPPPTPYTASGSTPGGETAWTVATAGGIAPWGVETIVDTSEAGFGDTPAYLARVVGTRTVTAAQAPHGTPCLLDGAPHVVDAEPGRFRLVVPLTRAILTDAAGALIEVNPTGAVASALLPDLVSNRLGWSVEWIGVQS
ncbi:hypothetical protein [Microbacterium terricola]|uniref:Uncharacterized protein n=1 Tax=Microbacterium terricola TaxID=344163 RepID=A0ABM8E1A9_9MICO|nr:hypothetical protein [Microbacterium terricola]UYK40723.1 hypothetical protein OAU46_03465 [Microbacterium terricola]BDV31540.1 hypothetical protein Microterr_22000 [Microbacterium terricola]